VSSPIYLPGGAEGKILRVRAKGEAMPDYEPLQAGDPRHLGEHQIVGRLGEGGQGVVYLARNGRGEWRAIKTLHGRLLPDAAARDRLLQEVEAARRLPPFCTAKIYAVSMEDPGRPYIVSEYLAARSLHAIVEEEGPLRGGALDHLAVGTVTILAATHQKGIVHRDLKPHNVLVGPDGPRVVDFGIARALEVAAAATSGPVGTPAYMAPEQLREEPAGTAADMFGWAVTMAYAATGRPAFGGAQYRAVERILHDQPDIAGVPEPLRKVVARCLDPRPERRPAAREVLDELMSAAPERPVEIITAGDRPAQGDITIDPRTAAAPPASPAAAPPASGSPAGGPAAGEPAPGGAAAGTAGTIGPPGPPGPARPAAASGAAADRPAGRSRPGRRLYVIAASALIIVAGASAAAAVALHPGRKPGGPPRTGPTGGPPAIVVGSANFPESALLGEIYAQALEARGLTVTRKFNLGSREVYYGQIRSGAIDVMPEYNGALASFIGATGIDGTGPRTTSAINRLLRRSLPPELKILHSAAAEDKDSVTVTRQVADRYGLKSLADLERAAPDMVMGGAPEFETRHEGLLGLRVRYHVNFKDYQPFTTDDRETMVGSLRNGAIQAADLFTTDPAIRRNAFVVLKDPGQFFSAQNVTPLVYTRAVNDKAQQALNDVSGELTTDDLLELNTDVADGKDPAAVARQWLIASDIVR
jgi:glycine betaine/choline ABC-type transport system substrate-binding protein